MLWTLKAKDDDNDEITIRHPDYETESRHLVTIRQNVTERGFAAADIILNQTLDRDYVGFKPAGLDLVDLCTSTFIENPENRTLFFN